jgi:hypothetical protein
MAFKYGAAVTLPAFFDLEERIVDHCHSLGFRFVEAEDGHWMFHRGSKLSILYRIDIRAYDTKLEVRAHPTPEGKVEVHFEYEIWTLPLTVFMFEDIARLETEVAQFVRDCFPTEKNPLDLMSVSRLPGQFLPLWLVVFVIAAPVLVLGLGLGFLVVNLTHR